VEAAAVAFVTDKEELKPGLIIFRRGDVEHRNWYCRVKLPRADRYKTVSLKTADLQTARHLAWEQEVEIRALLKRGVPVFNRPFSQVGEEYISVQEKRAEIGEITIRFEMSIFRGVMTYALSKRYISADQRFEGRPNLKTERRDEFTLEEYRRLHTKARAWIKDAASKRPTTGWYRTVVYNFILIMCNTGSGSPRQRATVLQQKTGRPAPFEITEPTREALTAWLEIRGERPDDWLFPSRRRPGEHISTRQYARLVREWVGLIDLDPGAYGTHSLRGTKVALVYKKTGNLRACQLLLGRRKLESTVRYLGVEVDDALELSE
jgi:Phage integrase family